MTDQVDNQHIVRKDEVDTEDLTLRRYVVAVRKDELSYNFSESEIDLLENSIQNIQRPSPLFHTLWATFFGAFVTVLFSVLFATQLSPVAQQVGYSVLALSAILTALCFILDRREGNKLVTSRQNALEALHDLKKLYSDPRDPPGNAE